MKEVFETKRLKLRELTVTDAQHFFNLNNDPDVIKYTGDIPFKDLEEAITFLKNYDQYEKYGIGRWAVIEKSSNNFLGWCGLKYNEDIDEIDLGFRFFKKYWGNRLATEAATASLDYGFNVKKYDSIIGRAMIVNEASIRILEKLGMKLEKEFDAHGGKCKQYRISKEMFLKRKNE